MRDSVLEVGPEKRRVAIREEVVFAIDCNIFGNKMITCYNI